MLKIEKTSVYENIPAWNVKIDNLPSAEIIKNLFNNSINGREYYQGGNEEIDLLIENIKKEADDILEQDTDVIVYFIKDSPKYKLIPHYDNNKILGIMMINLVDNHSSTIMYSKNNEELYVSSTQKGKGIFYLNDIECKHGFCNNSDDFRYAIMISINKP